MSAVHLQGNKLVSGHVAEKKGYPNEKVDF